MDCLRLIATVGNQYKAVGPLLQRTLLTTGATQIVDLCSGGGGPWLRLGEHLKTGEGQAPPILLTDLYPPSMVNDDKSAGTGQIRWVTTPIDATQLPATVTGLRTLFTAFHHFPPHQAQAILQDAVNAGQGIAIFEQTARTPLAVLFMVVLPWLALVAVPMSQPWRLARFFWTFIIPAIPLVLWFDGIVSCLRTYSAAEQAQLVAALAPSPTGLTYEWQIGKVRSPLSPLGVHYLIGYPVNAGGK